jgi:hypothetical protein
VSLWNSLDANIRAIDSLSQFKITLKKMLYNQNENPSYFQTGSRYLSIMHARLRNKCSNLNFDLYTNHLKINGICECGVGNEDSEHFFFLCQFYNESRIKLFRSLHVFHPLNTNILLNGSPDLSYDENVTIFKAVQSFIKETSRFKI